MSSHVEPLPEDELGSDDEGQAKEEALLLIHCTECEYVAPNSEFLPDENR